jgi:hypothetical protein
MRVRATVALVFAALVFGCSSPEKPAGDPEERIVAYLDKTVTPGKPVLVTELANNVFTEPDEQKALRRLYDAVFQIPAFAVKVYTETGKIPTRQEITDHFQFRVPGTTDVLLRILESDPRVPAFFTRDPASGEITAIDVDAIRRTDRFGDSLR